MLSHLFVENFKAWKELDIEFGQVTGLFGTNSSGKSSLLQFLLMLKQTKNATDRGLVLDFGASGQLVNLGSYQDIIHAHNRKARLKWILKWSLSRALTLVLVERNDTLASGSDIAISSVARQNGLSLVSDFLEYQFGEYKFFIKSKDTNPAEFELYSKLPDSSLLQFNRINVATSSSPLPGPIKTHLFPDQAKTYYKHADFLSIFEAEYESMMDSIYYLGPLREYPKREYTWSGASPTDVGWRGERTMEAILAASLKGETRALGNGAEPLSFQEIIAHWLKELNLIHEFKIEEIAPGTNLYWAIVKRDANGPTALLTDVGFGVSQILPALVLLYYVPEGSTVLMEQPEIHLHPSVQSGLADVILKVAETRKLQVIVESHSEHLLRRLQRRVAENQFKADQIKLFFCDSVNGESKLIDLELDAFGQIQNWPPNFFGDEMTEIAETRKAILRRKMEATQG